MSDIPVLISGAGPVGLYLALSLTLNGIPVRIFEKSLEFHNCSRGAAIQPRTLEFQRILGIQERVLNWGGGTLMSPLAIYKMPGGVEVSSTTPLLAESEPTPSCPYGTPHYVPQYEHERIVREALGEHGVEVERGKELISFEQDDEGVTVTLLVRDNGARPTRKEVVRAQFMCGADGAKGPTRRLMGCTFVGNTKDSDASLVADQVIHGLHENNFHMWKISPGQSGTAIFCRPLMDGKNTFTTIVMGFSGSLDPEELVKPGALVEFFKKSVGRPDLDPQEPITISSYRPHVRMVDKFEDGRVFVLGDAAHVHPPTGGQGLNAGVADALNLAWKLALVVKQLAPFSLLETYTEERRPVIAHMLQETAGLYNLVRDFKNGEPAPQTPRIPKRGMSDSFYKATSLALIGVNYRWSPIVADTRLPLDGVSKEMWKTDAYGGNDEEIRAGDRTPQAPGLIEVNATHRVSSTPVELYDVLSPSKHTIILFPRSCSHLDPSFPEFSETFPTGTAQTVIISRAQRLGDVAPVTVAADREFIDAGNHAHLAFRISSDADLTIIVVRPDTYIGAVAHTIDQLRVYSQQIFGIL